MKDGARSEQTAGGADTKQLPGGAQTIEYVEVVTPAPSRRSRVLWWLALGLVAMLSAATGTFYWYQRVVVPAREDAVIKEALAALIVVRGDGVRRVLEGAEGYEEELRLLRQYGYLAESEDGLNEDLRQRGARALLSKATRAGSVEAWIELGLAHRDGTLGPKDHKAALAAFERALEATEPGVKLSESHALYLRARMLQSGLGVAADAARAEEMAMRAIRGMNSLRIYQAGEEALFGRPPFNEKNIEAAKLASEKAVSLAQAQSHKGPLEGALRLADLVCKEEKSTRQACRKALSLAKAQGHRRDATNLAMSACREENSALQACEMRLHRIGADAGLKSSMIGLIGGLLQVEGDLHEALSWAKRHGAKSFESLDERLLFGLLQGAAATNFSELLAAFGEVKQVIELAAEDHSHGRQAKNLLLGKFDSTIYEWEGVICSDRYRVEVERVVSVLRAYAISQGALPKFLSEAKVAMFLCLNDETQGGDYGASLINRPQVVATAQRLLGDRGEEPRLNKKFVPLSKDAVLDPGSSVMAAKAPDPEQQSATGYVPGAYKGAEGGLSEFTVDNTSGGGDAIGRLYLEGRRPAARSFFIKKGERFTARSIASGTYVLRYRYMGSDDTYEADRKFVLNQTEESDGTKYSRVTVTLYSVRDGNLQTKKVPPESF